MTNSFHKLTFLQFGNNLLKEPARGYALVKCDWPLMLESEENGKIITVIKEKETDEETFK